ncbi:RNA polymerase sigma factor [Larkinella bovis]|uniref:RNA polymerase sigma factor n=1 Tax=Larkinella bovis TaxID=683041 RepID=A0ABW0IH48_9BACT
MKLLNQKPKTILDDPDEDLLIIMSMVDDPSNREKAFQEFYNRYAQFLYNYICRIANNQLTIHEMVDIFDQTFLIIYQKSGQFDARGESDSNIIRIKIQGWLARIIKNVFLKYIEERWSTPTESLDFENDYVDESTLEEEEEQITYSYQLVDQALNQLPERERHMLVTYLQYYKKGNGNQSLNLPDEILKALCKRYGTTPGYFRQIVKRSKDKVDQYVRAHYKPELDKSHAKRK